ncbi:MAG: response regulator [Acetobacteraceae bacterium]|nr:response regulator [Acetobacteraceae bacterium]
MPIAEYLTDCRCTVLEAVDAHEAIEVVDAKEHVDLVFSDVRMPGDMDGFGLARWIRAHHPEIPVLLASGFSVRREANHALSHEVPLITKPYSQSRLQRRINEILSSRGL